MGWKPIEVPESPLTTKGDVHGYSTTDARLPVGSNTEVLTADSTQTLGIKWAAAGGDGTIENITGAYDIEGDGTASHTDAGLSDEFASGTLDGQWTAVGMVSGTAAILTANPTDSVYDLSTRSGTLLVQLKPADQAYLRADSFIASGEQIIVSISVPAPGDLAGANNSMWVGIGYNDNDTDPYAGADAQLIWDGAGDQRMLFMHSGGGGTVGEFDWGAPVGRRAYYRFIRDSDTVYGYFSIDGTVWSPLNSTTVGVSTANNFWLVFDSNSIAFDHAPIVAVNWVRHVANQSFDAW